jgi:hypothetical protein
MMIKMRDFIARVFYGFFVDDKEAKKIGKKYSSAGEEDGWLNFHEMLEQKNDPVDAAMIADGIDNNGDVKAYRLALVIRASDRWMYVNMNNEIHKIKDLTATKKEWDDILKKFCLEHGITFAKPEWWLCTEGE